MVLGEDRLKVSVINIPGDDEHSIRVYSPLLADEITQ